MPPHSSISNRRRKRIAVIVVSTVLLGAGVAAAFVIQGQRQDAQAQGDREAAIAALEAGDYERTVELLTPQLRAIHNDAEMMWVFAQARRHVPLPQDEHRRQAFRALQRTVQLNPDNREAVLELTDVYLRLNQSQYNTDALKLAEQLLVKNPDDPEMLEVKAEALERLARHTEALAAAERLLELQPDKFERYRRVLRLMQQSGASPEQLVVRAQEWAEQMPGDLRPKLAMSYAFANAKNPVRAITTLREVKNEDPPDADFALEVAALFDQYGLDHEGTAYLSEKIDAESNETARVVASLRLLYADRLAGGVALLETLDMKEGPIAILGWHAMANRMMENNDVVAADLERLKARATDSVEKVWYDLLSVALVPRPDLPKVVEQARKATTQFPKVAEFRFLLATALAETGDRDSALHEAIAAAELADAWGRPHELAARLLLSSNRPEEAMEAARRAAQIADSPSTHLVYLDAVTQLAPSMESIQVDRQLEQIRRLKERASDPTAFELVELELLIAAKRNAAARTFASEFLAGAKELTAAQLAKLVDLNAAYSLGVGDALAQRLESVGGGSPDAMRAKAIQMMHAGQSAEAIAMLEQAIGEAKGVERARLLLVQGEVLEQMGQTDRAGKAFHAAATAAPEDLITLQRVVSSAAARKDREAIDGVLDQLRKLTGEQAPQWRLARAQWLLESETVGSDVARQVVQLVEPVVVQSPNSPLPHLLLAEAAQKLGQMNKAADSLRVALTTLPPGETAVQARLGLARVLIRQRNYEKAGDELHQVLRNRNASAGQRAQAARMLVVQGDTNESMQVLRTLQAAGQLEEQDQLVLASLYAQAQDMESATQILQPLLANAPSADAITVADALYTRVGRVEEARAALEKLEQLKLTSATKHEIWAQHYARLGEAESAISRFDKAIAAEPDRATHYASLIHYLLSTQRAAQALKVVDRAPAAVQKRPEYVTLLKHRELIGREPGSTEVSDIAAAMILDPAAAEASDAALTILTSREKDQDVEALAEDLGKLADRYPDNPAVANLAARLRQRLGQLKISQRTPQSRQQGLEALSRAAELATRTMYTFPRDETSAQIAAESYAAAEQWSKALNAGQIWSARSPRSRIAADLLIARAQRARSNPEAAVGTLEKYESAIKQGQEGFAPLAREYGLSLVQAGRTRQAANLLSGLLNDSVAYRNVWLSIISEGMKDGSTSAQWLQTAAAATPESDATGQARLATVWYASARRASNPEEFLLQAIAHIERALALEDSQSGWWALRGELAEGVKDWDTAEASYRRALRLTESMALRNNLAMALVQKGDNLDEAVALAQQAVESDASDANFRDTYAQTLAAAGRLNDAIEQMRSAHQLDLGNPVYTRRLIAMLREAGQDEEADKLARGLGD